jgi:hypothetical protein
MSELAIYNARIHGRNKVKSKHRNRKKISSNRVDNADANDVYKKAVEEYEEYKRISKNNIHDSVGEESTTEAI